MADGYDRKFQIHSNSVVVEMPEIIYNFYMDLLLLQAECQSDSVLKTQFH